MKAGIAFVFANLFKISSKYYPPISPLIFKIKISSKKILQIIKINLILGKNKIRTRFSNLRE